MEPQAQRPLRGILWMLITGLLFVAVTAVVKLIGDRIPAPQAAFLRYLLGVVFLVPMLPIMRQTAIDRSTLILFGGRGLVHGLGVIAWFYAMTQIPIAEVTALNYAAPVYATIGAALFLGERLAARRIAAIGVAFLGALVILRPGLREIELGHIAMLGAGLAFAGSYLTAKILSGRVPPLVVVGWLSLLVPVVMAPFALAVWVPPTLSELAWLFLVAALATAGHYTMTVAFREAPLTVTQPVTFLQLVWATSLGVVFFAEPLDAYVVLGGAMILAAVSFITWREAVLKRRATPGVVETKV
ncbi:MAG: DMT family transporter [Pseudomonadota bacterium]